MDTLFRRSFLVCVVCFTIGAAARAEDTVPDLPADSPKQKPITIESKEETDDRVWAVESMRRSNYIYPSNYGTPGLFRVRSAESLPKGALTFGIGGEFYWIDSAPAFSGSSTAKTIAESLFVGYSPAEHVTIAVMRRNSSTTFGSPQQLISSLGDFTFSGLYSFQLSQSMSIAPIAEILVASNFNSLSPAGTTLSLGVGAALTYSLYPAVGVPLFLHANLKYHMPQIRTSKAGGLEPEIYFNFSRFNTVTLGLGGEYVVSDSFIPFIEFQHQGQADATFVSYFNSPLKLSLGTRFMPLENKSLAFLLGADVGLKRPESPGVPFTPPYQILGQVSYTFGLDQTERKHYLTTNDVNIVDRKFVIRKKVEFKLNSAELEPSSTGLLDEIANVIKKNQVKKLLIVGHTDSTHTEEYNLKLSLARANTVKTYLIRRGVHEDVLMAQGFGKRKPIAPNTTEAGRSKNRRVEFFILE
jgi:outer membrane protein OmpA-like peptidoglycan-associated protein